MAEVVFETTQENNQSIDQQINNYGDQTLLRCPIRGQLNARALAKDGMTPTEEARRIDFITFLLARSYPPENIAVETVILKKLGESGRNKLRCDVIVYDTSLSYINALPSKERLDRAI